jgi:hypothetical protein
MGSPLQIRTPGILAGLNRKADARDSLDSQPRAATVQAPHVRIARRAVSSMAEQVPFKHKVAGSSPARPTPDPRTMARRSAGSIVVTVPWFGSIKGLKKILVFQHLRVPVNTHLHSSSAPVT